MLKVSTIVGARPQIIKAAVVSRAFQNTGAGRIEEFIVHTGQHYDEAMSQIFFDQLGLARPRYNLGIGSGSHGKQTGRMLMAIEEVLIQEKPGCVLVFGDTNSTLAGALAAAKLHIPLAHVEAGLRSWNRNMPEEVNRVLTDHLANLLFAPTETAVRNLANEGITSGVHLIGDVMQDAIAEYARVVDECSSFSRSLGLQTREYLLVTVHRAENTDDLERLSSIVKAIQKLAEKDTIVWPVHPRTRQRLNALQAELPNVRLIAPVGYLEMISLERNADVVLTDSGGVQKEARWLQVPCVTLRDETEWVETLANGWNQLAGVKPERIIAAVMQARQKRNGHLPSQDDLVGPRAASRIVEQIAIAGTVSLAP